jgi:hypothetical protein
VARRLQVPKVTVDFSDVQEFTALEKGEYPVVIQKATFRPADQHGKEFDSIELELEVSEGEAKGRKLWTYLSFSPKALWRMKEVFEKLGVYNDEVEVDYDEDADNILTEPEIIGLPAWAVVSQRPYEGRMTNQVDQILSVEEHDGATAGKKGEPGKKKATPAKKTEKAAPKRKFK